MSWGRDIGIENWNVDLYVIRFHIGFMIRATLSQMVTISLALILFAKIGKNL